jgi:hypothetical protein
MSRLILSFTLVVLVPLTLVADTLVLRNGTRIDGELLSIRNGVIEFEERRGFGRGRRIEIDRDDVVRIEFDARPAPGRDFTSGGRPAGMRERQVTVAANVAWSDTGLDVRAGQTVYFEAAGEIRWGRDRRDGPGGERNSPSNPNRPIPNRPAAALIGKVGSGDGDAFFIGDERGAVRVRDSGRLYLGVNDDFLADNSGSFRVVVYH